MLLYGGIDGGANNHMNNTKYILAGVGALVLLFALSLVAVQKKPVGALGDYSTGVTNSSVNVGTSSTQVLTAKSDRQNTSFSECAGYATWLSLEDTAVVGKGILLTVSMTINDLINPNNPFTGNVYAISTSSAGKICYTDK